MNSSVDSGSSWTGQLIYDAIFEVWGSPGTPVSLVASGGGQGSGSGVLVFGTQLTVSGGGQSGGSGILTIKANWQSSTFKSYRRLVAAGNDAIWYEDI